MNAAVSRFLRDHVSSEIEFVNSLFVTVFVTKNNWIVRKNSLLSSLIIKKNNLWYPFVVEFTNILDTNNYRYTLEELINLFEFVISPADKIINGAIYTPQRIRNYILEYCFDNICISKNLKISDLACGCGGFLKDAAEMIHLQTGKTYKQIYQNNIYGIDIQSYSIRRTEILLSLLAISQGEDDNFKFNLWTADTLAFNFKDSINDFKGFDIIVGNPPYVCSRRLSDEARSNMRKWSVCRTGHPDLYIPFFQIAVENLKENGMMGYITMNSFMKSLNGRALRELFKHKSNRIRIIDFRSKQVFEKKSTYTCICFVTNQKSSFIEYAVDENASLDTSIRFQHINYSQLDSRRGWNLNNTQDVHALENIGTPIGKFSQSRHGIATLCNKVYIFSPVRETQRYYILNKDGNEYNIEKGLCKDIVNPNKLNSDVIIGNIIEKVIFPYRKDENGKMQIIPETILQNDYPNAYHYLETQKDKLATRDKGKGKDYPVWYQFGRTQSLNMPPVKLFFPKIANRAPRCVLVNDPDLYLYNGMAFVGEDEKQMMILQKVFESSLFWNYLISNSKPYSSDYYSLNGEYIKNFGIFDFTEDEITYLLNETDREAIDTFLKECYARM